ncbi:hypothetical protein [Lysinibacillus sphaericus]|nr:hypothetical protein [Lysinibacillus sp. SDF0037]
MMQRKYSKKAQQDFFTVRAYEKRIGKICENPSVEIIKDLGK